MRDERQAELAAERGVALLVEGFECRGTLPKEFTEKTRLPWTVCRPDERQDGGLDCGIHIAKDAGKPCSASTPDLLRAAE